MNENNYIKTIAIYYAILLFSFGLIYYLMIWHNPNHFYIPEYIKDKRKEDSKLSIYSRLEQLEKEKEELGLHMQSTKSAELFSKSILEKKQDKRLYLKDTFSIILPQLLISRKPDSILPVTEKPASIFSKGIDTIGYTLIFYFDSLAISLKAKTHYECGRSNCWPTGEFDWSFVIGNKQGEKILINNYITNNEDKYLSELRNFSGKYLLDKQLYLKYGNYVCSTPVQLSYGDINYIQSKIISNKKEISQYKNMITENKVDWGILDIMYFTVVSLGLSNYSDITPNCTLSRTLVLIEQLLSIYLLVYAINLKITNILQAGKKLSDENLDNDES